MAHHRQHHHVRYTRQHHRRTKSTDGYKSFGSFHSDNVEELIRLPKDQYTPPELPFAVSEESRLLTPSTSSSYIPFANSNHYIKSYSHLDRNNWAFLNHGAFGLALDIGLHRANLWRTYLESQPLRYFDRYLLNHLAHSARMMVEFVTQNEEDASKVREGIALIQNVTSGMNAVIGGHARCANYMNNRRLAFYYDIAYGSNKKMCQRYHGNENAISIPFEDDFLPLLQKVTTSSNPSLNRMDNDWNSESAEVFIKALDITIHKLIKRHGDKSSVNGSLLILDHITSNTAIHIPICAIAKYAKEEYDMTVVVDGAHSLLSLPLDISTILSTGEANTCGHVDVYLTNAHKWFSSPRGAALLFCNNPGIHDTILAQPAVISHGVDDGFLSRFMWDGCRDYSAQLSLPSILNYWSTANIDNVRREMQTNLEEGVRILISHWHPDSNTSSHGMKYLSEQDITLVPLQMHAPMMALVRFPYHISGGDGEQKTSTDAKQLQDFLHNHNVEVPVKCIRGKLYARVSCHVYNTEGEFIRLAEVALKYSLR